MSAQDDPSRNLPATAKRLRTARADGNVPRSRDLGHFAALAVATMVLYATAAPATQWLQRIVGDGLRFDARIVQTPALAAEIAGGLFLRGLIVVVAVGLGMGLVGVIANIALGGWNLSFKAVSPDFGRLNPMAGLGRLYSKQALVNTLKACLLAIAVGTAGTLYLQAHAADLARALGASLPQGLGMVAGIVGSGLVSLLVVLGLWALVDVPLQKFQWHARLKMTRDEVKQEQKEAEGNSEVKAKIKNKMRQLARRRMMQAVPAADIVVMNPTHYAVALKYQEGSLGAPRVVAKGADRLAIRIRDLALEAGVPVLQSPPLARALYVHVEVDGEVPANLFAAVAQVLAWVYQMRRTPAAASAPPEVVVPAELDPLTNPLAGRPGRRARPATGAAAVAEDDR